MKILLTGPQGSGKTTQGEILSKKFSICLVDSGELIRRRAEGEDELGQKLKEQMDKGELVDLDVAANLVKERLSQSDCQSGFILDGYPRSVDQLKLFDPEFDFVVYIDLPDEVVIERMLKRAREDDTPEAIKERLQIFHQRTQEVLQIFEAEGKLIKVDGSGTPQEVSEKIISKL